MSRYRRACAILVVCCFSGATASASERREQLFANDTNHAVRGVFTWNADSIDVSTGRMVFDFVGAGRSWARFGGRTDGRARRYRLVYRTYVECVDQATGEAVRTLRSSRIVGLGGVPAFRRRNLPAVQVPGPVGSDCPAGSVLSDSPLATVRVDTLRGGRWRAVVIPLTTI